MKYSFILDSMMGKEARWLRILGYNVLYDKYLEDKKITTLLYNTNRLLITRDVELFKKCIKNGLTAIYTSTTDICHFLHVFKKYVSMNIYIDFKQTRCPKCNGKLIIVNKRKIRNKVSSYIYIRQNIFYQCIECGHIYWLGRHLKNMQRILGDINEC
ncbi:MAG: hypothetical protein J7K23_06840 [Thermoproteales archaeon]|nr:hypothetical protein [Thermoproteales archaeon]